jgi:hypothetical protein
MAHTEPETGLYRWWPSKGYKLDLNCSSQHSPIEPQAANGSTDGITIKAHCWLQNHPDTRCSLSTPIESYLSSQNYFGLRHLALERPCRPVSSFFDHCNLANPCCGDQACR